MISKNKTPGNLMDSTQYFVFYLSLALSKIDKIAFLTKSLLETADFRIWLKRHFDDKPTHKTKHDLLGAILTEQGEAPLTHYIEFGVAYGDTAQFILENAKGQYIYSGFDTFKGLPEPWRRLQAGAFSNGGMVPGIHEENFVFYKGLINDTINEIQIQENSRKIVLFDFDLYQPTLFAFQYLIPHLNKGDILYFDEAFDSAERTIIENYVLTRYRLKFLAATSLALAVEIQ